jgi:hypothetical protein
MDTDGREWEWSAFAGDLWVCTVNPRLDKRLRSRIFCVNRALHAHAGVRYTIAP